MISTSILVSGVMNQAPTPTPTNAKKMETALEGVIKGKCWKVGDVAGVKFTASRRAQSPTPDPTPNDTCPDDWKKVVDEWTENNKTRGTIKADFEAAMIKVSLCLEGKRRLQEPTPPPKVDNCKEGEEALGKVFDTLQKTLGNSSLSKKYVNGADAVNITHDPVKITGDNGAQMTKSENDA